MTMTALAHVLDSADRVAAPSGDPAPVPRAGRTSGRPLLRVARIPGPPAQPADDDSPRGSVGVQLTLVETPRQQAPTLPRADAADLDAWSGQLAQAICDAAVGLRPVGQLQRWTSEDVHGWLRRRADLTERLRARQGGPTPVTRMTVRSTRVCRLADGVAEVSAVLAVGDRCRALALRLEHLGGRWRAVVVELV